MVTRQLPSGVRLWNLRWGPVVQVLHQARTGATHGSGIVSLAGDFENGFDIVGIDA